MKKLIDDLKRFKARNDFAYHEKEIFGMTISHNTYMLVLHPILYIADFLSVRKHVWSKEDDIT